MSWNLKEAIAYYKGQGAPSDQTAMISLLREVQAENGGQIPMSDLPELAQGLAVKESYLQAVIRRIPRLRLAEGHCLELCGGVNCSKRALLAAFVEKTYGKEPQGFKFKVGPCMRMCGKGPNIKWDGKLYHQADEALLRSLIEE